MEFSIYFKTWEALQKLSECIFILPNTKSPNEKYSTVQVKTFGHAFDSFHTILFVGNIIFPNVNNLSPF